MPENHLNRFFISIVLPSILTIGLFVLSIFTVILPSAEKNIMKGKKEMLSELTNTAWSLADEYYRESLDDRISEKDAMLMAAERIGKFRYGSEQKDYFWITNEKPVMIMHPYRPDLIGKDLSDYRDPNGKLLFLEASRLVQSGNNGYIDYFWQWKDDSTRIVPKLSFVKSFEAWNWIIGTGIYLEDVRAEIKTLKHKLLRLTFIISVFITVLLSIIIRQSLNIENRRNEAENKLRLSRQKYKSLVDASTESMLMILNKNIIYSNLKFSELVGYEVDLILKKKFGDLFTIDFEKLNSALTDPLHTVSTECGLKRRNGSVVEVVISMSGINYASETAYVIVVKEMSRADRFERGRKVLSDELQDSLLMMTQSIHPYVKPVLKCSLNTSIQEVSRIMKQRMADVVFIEREGDILGTLTAKDLNSRVVAENLDVNRPVFEVMTSPLVTISREAPWYEALLKMDEYAISHLGVRDGDNTICGSFGMNEILEIRQNSLSFLLQSIENARNVEELAGIHNKIPVLVLAISDSENRISHVCRLISSVADGISKRIIRMAIHEAGEPPCNFAFMAMGSEGRKEQSLVTDQDNAIIYNCRPGVDKQRAARYFLDLGKKINDDLHKAGYSYCQGNIMAGNPEWNMPPEKWREFVNQRISDSDPKGILEAGILFDFRFIYGDESLVNDLRAHVHQAIEHKPVFIYQLAQSVMNFRPPLNLFSKMKSGEENPDPLNMDMKKVLMPVTTFIRLYALQQKLEVTNSLERLEKLTVNQILNKSISDELRYAFQYLMHLRIRQQALQFSDNQKPDNLLNIYTLSSPELMSLKRILTEMTKLESFLNMEFKGSI